MTEKEIIIQRLREIKTKTGGILALRFILDALGAYSFFSNPNIITDKIEKTIEWLEESNTDLGKISETIDAQLSKPTKANLSLLLGEVLGLEIPFMIKSGTILQASVILNSETLREFTKYEDLGLITITPNDNNISKLSGIPIVDKKRPLGINSKFIITLNELYYT